ncbi:phage major capsid protein [Heyndrickxia oleronia]|uniref:phage major capsid protein n=1 Tax=Heyndrickxia oleronia TaxID=38875 RepID=UPI00203A9A78|nr:phage major capsid protein [Heyndrickxia oleronia]MCM3452742.1 phage major capsid protein [Heyndrickxia oleronia]
MPTNQQILTKEATVATIKKNLDIPMAVSDAEAFLVDTINNASTLPKLAPIYRDVPAGNIDALSVGRRKIRQAGKDDKPTGTDSIGHRQIPYAVKKVKWDEWLQNDDVYYSISARGDNVEQKVISMIQQQFGVDLQDLIFNGDTEATIDGTTPDPFLSIIDGFVKKMKASPNKTDLATNEPQILDFVNHIQLLPERYKSFPDIAWFITQKTNDKLVAMVANRQTGFGDAVLQDGKITRLAGYPVEVVAELQSGFAALTPRSNLKPVFTRQLRYIRTADGATAAAKDATYHVLYAYLDAIVREIPAVAWMTGDKL